MFLIIFALSVVIALTDILSLKEVWLNRPPVVALNFILIAQSAKLFGVVDIEFFLCLVDFNATHNIQDTYIFIYLFDITVTTATV